MKSPMALIGGEEFADGFEDVHAGLLELARSQRERFTSRGNENGNPIRVVFLPTCATEDGPETVTYWCDEAQRRLGALGAQVFPARIVDRVSADDEENTRLIAEADLIYFGGGYPHVGMRILSGTRALQAIMTAHQRGTLIAGASAGAMMMGARSWVITPEFDANITELLSTGSGVSDWDMPLPPSLECLGMVPRSMCWPHANLLFSVRWLKNGLLPPGHFVIGIDEQTALVNAGTDGWEVQGRGKVTLVDSRYQVRELPAGSHLERL